MMALVLENTKDLRLRDIELNETVGPEDVRIQIHTVGICGSDVHFYEFGRIGTCVARAPMVLGHEASGVVIAAGEKVRDIKVGDRVCMEPGIPDKNSREYRMGKYNIDPNVVFWATPPVHGCLRPSVVHPADFTFRLPDNVSFGEGALVEPFSVGVHAVNKAHVKIGNAVLVIGAGTIGIVTALAALSAGAGKVIVSDVSQKRLDMCAKLFPGLILAKGDAQAIKDVMQASHLNGVDIVFEASGASVALQTAIEVVSPGGCIVQIGCPVKEVSLFVSDAQNKELRLEFIFRYAHVYPTVLALFSSGRIDVKRLISRQYSFAEGVTAFEEVSRNKEDFIKAQIVMPQ